MSLHATHAVALLHGFASDYARILASQGNQSTAAAINGVAKEASESIVNALRAKAAPSVDTEPLPQAIAVETE